MNRDAVEIVGPERAVLAPFLPVGSQHEMVDDQLRAPGEEIGKRQGAGRPIEPVGFFHAFPRHFHAAARQRLPLPREFLFGGKQVQACLQPRLR
ncbi:hypothetical protein D3C87_1746310 [compost metagenome]